MPLIAFLGYLFTFGVNDHAIFVRAMIGVIALPLLLLVAVPGFLDSRQSSE